MTNEPPPTGWPLWLRLICLIGGLALWVLIIGCIPALARWVASQFI
ncbi:MAG: hypothetical protein ACU0A5_21740 [Salipiger marinus]